MVKRIHLIFKTHLDVGFTDFASNVTRNYFKKYIPSALRVAREMRESGNEDRFIWTTGSWLIYEYLEQANPVEKQEMENAILAGEIGWHGLPFTTHTELMDAELFRFGLSLSSILDARFGKNTTAAKMTDVPGHTMGIIRLLAEAGISFLHIGVNPGSAVPRVPGLFRWQHPDGSEVMVMYESGYGSAFEIPGLEDSIAFGHTIDNIGPQTAEQVQDVYREMRARFPKASVFASTLSAFGEKLEAIRPTLPTLTQEIGDTWIHGVGSDPIKVSRFRELLRLRSIWLKNGIASYSDPRFFNFNRALLMVPEHTWGMDEKTYLGDHESYSRDSFSAARKRPNFSKFESSWVEKRAYPQQAVNALEDTPLAYQARTRLTAIRPEKPDLAPWGKAESLEFNNIPRISLDEKTGGIEGLIFNAGDIEWADASHQLGLLSYQTFSASDYERFFDAYILPEQHHDWAREDFTKPGMETSHAQSRIWTPRVGAVHQISTKMNEFLLFNLTFESEALRSYGAPADVLLQYGWTKGSPEIEISLQWFNKPASRLPEAFWFSFVPLVHTGFNWRIEKLGTRVDPLNVVENGNRHLHASGSHVTLTSGNAGLVIEALDSPLVAPGQRCLLDFNNDLPDLSRGMHFCLYNNLWGTNFPMWFEEDCLFRFKIRFEE